jgi:hypothetical protein
MVSEKGTRKLEYKENVFYWFVRRDQLGFFKIHILSEDKKIHLDYLPIDTEAIITPKDVRILLEDYFASNET